MGSDATIPDGFTADGENYIKAVALTENNYQLTADGKGNFTYIKKSNIWILHLPTSKPSIKLLNLALIDFSKKLFQFRLMEMPSIDLKMWQHPEKHPDL